MKRRDLLRALGAMPLLTSACSRQEADQPSPEAAAKSIQPSQRMPVIFAAHGAPVLLDEAGWVGELAAWAKALPKPRAVLMISAHWEERPATLGATRTVPLVYDFYGFPRRYYEVQYPAPGAPELAARVRELLREKSIATARPRRSPRRSRSWSSRPGSGRRPRCPPSRTPCRHDAMDLGA